MINILSHRGWWNIDRPKNSFSAFDASFSFGFGVETDIRDLNGQLVISHDVPLLDSGVMMFDEFLKLVLRNVHQNPLTIALNIKSDGLASLLKEKLSCVKNSKIDWFVFDMSVPDMKDYLHQDFSVFSRISEIELNPAWISDCTGIWLDSFESEWFSISLISKYLDRNKRVCIVSPELHGRDYMGLWHSIYPLRNNHDVILCTDYPDEAYKFFSGDQ